jgi:hypothetical protein
MQTLKSGMRATFVHPQAGLTVDGKVFGTGLCVFPGTKSIHNNRNKCRVFATFWTAQVVS